jgi:uncharacterized protein YkwD
MKTICVLLGLFISLYTTNSFSQEIKVSKEQAKLAFEYLNKIRAAPSDYSKEIGISLSSYKNLKQLIWSDTLAELAIERASDMATKKYFGHVDKKGEGIDIKMERAGWPMINAVNKKSQNSWESICAGPMNGEEMIKELIVDKGVSPPGHRYHLLSQKGWVNCTHIGIGYITKDDSQYQNYCVIIITEKK